MPAFAQRPLGTGAVGRQAGALEHLVGEGVRDPDVLVSADPGTAVRVAHHPGSRGQAFDFRVLPPGHADVGRRLVTKVKANAAGGPAGAARADQALPLPRVGGGATDLPAHDQVAGHGRPGPGFRVDGRRCRRRGQRLLDLLLDGQHGRHYHFSGGGLRDFDRRRDGRFEVDLGLAEPDRNRLVIGRRRRGAAADHQCGKKKSDQKARCASHAKVSSLRRR